MRILPLVICLAAAVRVQASSVTLSSSPTGPAVFDSTNTFKVANGSLVRVGMILNTADPAGSFVEFGTGMVRTAGIGSGARPGKITGSVIPSGAESTHGAFNNRPVYLWIYNSPGEAGATEQGIFGTSRVFPANDLVGFEDSLTITSNTEILTTHPISGFVTAQILPGDAEDSKHFVLGGSIAPPADSDGDGQPDPWENTYGLNPADPADAVLDADGDALDNRLEYALGSHPRVASPSALPVRETVEVSGTGYAAFRFVRLKNPVTATLVPEISTTLEASGWQGGPGALVNVSITDQGTTESVLVRDTGPLSTRRRLFFRLRLTVP